MRPSPRLRAFVQPRLCSLPARTQRLFSTSNLARNAATLQQTTVAKETRDIDEIDKLLASIRMKANPAYNSIMPMRVPALWAESVLHAEDHTASATRPKRNDSLVPRRMHDSYCELVLPFSDPTFLEGYTNVHGGIRMGKIMEHLDSLAGSISYKHVLGPDVQSLGSIQDVGFYMVTASVDRLDMLCPLEPSRDVRISGQVMYTGKSSMEIAVKVETISGGAEQTVLLGRFSMVCRDAVTHKARTINPLIISTPDEEALHTRGEEIKNGRRSQALKSLARVPPSSDEAELLHAFMLKYGQDLSEGSHERVWMGDTKLDRCMLMFPQERNVHQKIFGGYLMRLGYELGFSNASMFFRGGHIRFLSLDGISFSEPVPIGSILRLSSYVLHSTSTEGLHPTVHVAVTANVVDVETGQERTTNEFRFTWCRDDERASIGAARIVVPKTYKEAMLWLEGKRALEIGDEMRGMRTRILI
ncbi:unnamed protein product [Mycena citricolor]|uniref:HotDog ACOT-type domain-containing protein n=1 Tax=Mycena citricolor TaxID=2018698 RepID=A0AAD2K196_9AGAR|nr:unnamed protein product [Mycena citricolor]